MFEWMVVHKNSSGTIDNTKESSKTSYREKKKKFRIIHDFSPKQIVIFFFFQKVCFISAGIVELVTSHVNCVSASRHCSH